MVNGAAGTGKGGDMKLSRTAITKARVRSVSQYCP